MAIMLVQSDRTYEQLSRDVCQAIIQLAAESADMGWVEVEDTLRHVFSDVVEVEDDGYGGYTLIRKKGRE